MGKSSAKIQCTNSTCKALSNQHNRVCEKCHTPLTNRYLRLTGEKVKTYAQNTLLMDRYMIKSPGIVLDTKPALSPEIPEDLPEEIRTYLKLFPYKLNLPQVFGRLEENTAENPWGTWLLEYSSIPLKEDGELIYPELFPLLSQSWEDANGLRQLNWLWQIAKLWQPLHRQGVASTLLNPSLLRTNGANIHILKLESDYNSNISIASISQLWRQWLETCSPQNQEFLTEVCQSLETKEISNSEQLVAVLDQGLFYSGQDLKRVYNIITASESGPSRPHNEDACYPPKDKKVTGTRGLETLTIVCDGVGGQDAGEVASQMAIQNTIEQIKTISFDSKNWNPNHNIAQLKQVSNEVNDRISERNDTENRHERKRMGTTLISTIAQAHELYITHVGDSRVYWITPEGCYQLTVDDDLASREVRLGYALYREAIHYPNGGALFQALGMAPSDKLYPNVQRLIIDQNAIFLLCSDGLSDNERVEQYWRSEILPILEEKENIAKVAQKLIDIANNTNGHDNVTVALVHCQLEQSKHEENIIIPRTQVKEALDKYTQSKILQGTTKPTGAPPPNKMPTTLQLDFTPQDSVKKLPWFWILILIPILGILYFLFSLIDQPTPQTPTNTQTQPRKSPSASTPPPPASLPLKEGDVLKNLEPITLRIPAKDSLGNITINSKTIPAESIFQVIKSSNSEVMLKVCHMPQPTSDNVIKGYINTQNLQNVVKTVNSEEKNLCSTSDASSKTNQKPANSF